MFQQKVHKIYIGVKFLVYRFCFSINFGMNYNISESIILFQAVLGHTEDAFSETLNHFYIMSAHIIPTDEDKKHGVSEIKC